jgi:hypothetical protein
MAAAYFPDKARAGAEYAVQAAPEVVPSSRDMGRMLS